MRIARILALIPVVATFAGCATTGDKVGPVADTLCGIARADMALCDSGALLDKNRCRAAESAVIVCSIGGHVLPEAGLVAGLRPGVGLTPRSLQTCWRTLPGGPQKFGVGRLDVDPFEVAGMPGAPQGALPCGIEAVNLAYREAFGQLCIGEGSALGGYCGGPSNEALRTATPKLEWACLNRPDLLGSEGSSVWNCHPGGLDLLRLAAHVGGTQMLAAIDLAMGNGPPTPICGNGVREAGESCATCPQDVPGCPWCGNHRADPNETCLNCPADIGACPDGKIDCSGVILPPPNSPTRVVHWVSVASTGSSEVQEVLCRGGTILPPVPLPPPAPACIPLEDRQTACRCAGWTRSEQRKSWCAALCVWAKGLPTC
jgi:hypothetical protein